MRQTLIALSAALLLAVASPAVAEGPVISLRPGEQVTVIIDRDGNVVASQSEKAQATAYDEASVRSLKENHPEAVGPNAALLSGDDLPDPPAVEPGLIRIAFLPVRGEGGTESMLAIRNGYDLALRYRATITTGDKRERTDVCTVLPQLRGFEHWPWRIARIELSDLALVPYKQGTPPVCE